MTELADFIRHHVGLWDYDVSYDVAVACECGVGRDDDDEFDHSDHLAEALIVAGYGR